MELNIVKSFKNLAIWTHEYYYENDNLIIGNLEYRYQNKTIVYTLVKLEDEAKKEFGENSFGLTTDNFIQPRIICKIKDGKISFLNDEKYENENTVTWQRGAINIKILNVLEEYKDMF